ncbi:MAG: hypothetical protein K8R87_13740, partial [Verrucomicrobia bacterium]|nr:hypothetical protein [Verrucomicrobiota bacterium]
DEFDYKRYLQLQGIDKIFTVNGYNFYEVISTENLNFFEKYIVYPAKKYLRFDASSFPFIPLPRAHCCSGQGGTS